MARITVVNKDIATHTMCAPIVEALQAHGHTVDVYAEGLALERWGEQASKLPEKPPSEDFAAKLLQTDRSDMVITGLSSPINWEENFGEAANKLGVPLVFVSDIWGAESRSTAVPNLALVPDGIAEDIMRRDHTYADTTISVVGHSLVNSLVSTAGCPEQRFIDELRADGSKVLVLGGQAEFTSDMITWTMRSAQWCSTGRWKVIPRLHPKFKNNTELWSSWQTALESMSQLIVSDERGQNANANLLSLHADVTVSGYSSLLLASMLGRQVAVSITTQPVLDGLKAEMGLDAYPPIELGACYGLKDPANLDELAVPPPSTRVRFPTVLNRGKVIQAIEDALS